MSKYMFNTEVTFAGTVILRDVIQTFASRKRLLRVYQKEGGYPQAVRDFNTLRLNNVEDYGVKYRILP